MNELKLRGRVLSRVFNEMAIGTENERHDNFDPWEAPGDYLIGDAVIGTETGALRGYVYRPASGEVRGAVIFLSGSAGSNASQAGEAAAAYTSLGAAVFGIDYRGFGRSAPALDGGAITEATLFEDARRIYGYVSKSFPPQAIILHGFSLGGAPAAALAAALAEEGVPPGGLVLHSAIATMTEAAAGTLPLPGFLARAAGWAGGLLTGGAYDTRARLERLSRLSPEIPLHLRSGSAASGDYLGLDVTGLDRAGAFYRRTVYTGPGPHQIAPGKTAGNMKEGLAYLEELLPHPTQSLP